MLKFAGVFDLLPGWLWALLLAGTGALLGGEVWQHSETRQTLQQERTAYAKSVAAAAALTLQQEQLYRKLEQEIPNAISKLVRETYEPRLAQLSADLARSNAAAVGVRESARLAAERARQACANSGTGASSVTADDPVGVLANVLGRADARAGELAEIADARLIGWDLCVAQYNTVRDRFNQTSSQLDQLVGK